MGQYPDHDQRHGAQGKSKVYEEDQDERAKDAMIRYESRLMLISSCLVSLKTSKAGKGFHDLPEGLFGERNY